MRKREKEKKINGKKIGKRIAAAALGGMMVLSLAACGDSGKEDVIRVGSKDFTEGLIVAEIYALALEDAGYEVDRVFNIAGSVVHTSLINDEIDLYPEYTGTGLLSVLGMDMITDPQEDVYKRQTLHSIALAIFLPSLNSKTTFVTSVLN